MSTWKVDSMRSARSSDQDYRPSIFRRFVYLDRELIVNSLAYVEGGEIEARVDRVVSEVGAQARLRAFDMIELGGKRGRQIEEEVKRKRTIHSAIGILLNRLREARDLRTIGVPREGQEAAVLENQLVELTGDIDVWPRPRFEVAARRHSVIEQLRVWLGIPVSTPEPELVGPRTFVARVTLGDGTNAMVALHAMDISPSSAAELTRRVTVIGQVELVPRDDERLLIEPSEDGGCRVALELKEHVQPDEGTAGRSHESTAVGSAGRDPAFPPPSISRLIPPLGNPPRGDRESSGLGQPGRDWVVPMWDLNTGTWIVVKPLCVYK